MPVNVKRKSLTVEVSEKKNYILLTGCPCHITHNVASNCAKAFCKSLESKSDSKELFVDIYDRIDHSFKRKDLLI